MEDSIEPRKEASDALVPGDSTGKETEDGSGCDQKPDDAESVITSPSKEKNQETEAQSGVETDRRRRRARYVLHRKKEKAEFCVDDIVWVKLQNGLWWPGMILKIADASEMATQHHRKGNNIWVHYFVDLDRFRLDWFDESQLKKPFEKYYSQMIKQSSSEIFRYSVKSALMLIFMRYCRSVCTSLQPERLLEYVRMLALFPTEGANTGERVIAQKQLNVFYRWKGCRQPPVFRKDTWLMENKVNIQSPSTKRSAEETVEHRDCVRRKRSMNEQHNLKSKLDHYNFGGPGFEVKDVGGVIPYSSGEKHKVVEPCSSEARVYEGERLDTDEDTEVNSPSPTLPFEASYNSVSLLQQICLLARSPDQGDNFLPRLLSFSTGFNNWRASGYIDEN